jgi:hypothetical protein
MKGVEGEEKRKEEKKKSVSLHKFFSGSKKVSIEKENTLVKLTIWLDVFPLYIFI